MPGAAPADAAGTGADVGAGAGAGTGAGAGAGAAAGFCTHASSLQSRTAWTHHAARAFLATTIMSGVCGIFVSLIACASLPRIAPQLTSCRSSPFLPPTIFNGMFRARNGHTCGECHAYPSAMSFALMVPICTRAKRRDLAIPELEKASQRERFASISHPRRTHARFVTMQCTCCPTLAVASSGLRLRAATQRMQGCDLGTFLMPAMGRLRLTVSDGLNSKAKASPCTS